MDWLETMVRARGVTSVALGFGIHPATLKHALARGAVTLRMWEMMGVEVKFEIKEWQK